MSGRFLALMLATSPATSPAEPLVQTDAANEVQAVKVCDLDPNGVEIVCADEKLVDVLAEMRMVEPESTGPTSVQTWWVEPQTDEKQ